MLQGKEKDSYMEARCNICGSIVKDSYDFCPNCGVFIKRGIELCKGCGVEINIETQDFCPNCGMRIDKENVKTEKHSKNRKRAFAILIIICLVMMGAYLLISNNNKEKAIEELKAQELFMLSNTIEEADLNGSTGMYTIGDLLTEETFDKTEWSVDIEDDSIRIKFTAQTDAGEWLWVFLKEGIAKFIPQAISLPNKGEEAKIDELGDKFSQYLAEGYSEDVALEKAIFDMQLMLEASAVTVSLMKTLE